MSNPKRPARIAGCSGSASDRRNAILSVASRYPDDPVDVIIGDWMSEANMTARGIAKSDFLAQYGDTSVRELEGDAYEPSFLEALEPALDDISKHGIKVAVNAGASDTKALHSAVTKLVASKGLSLKIAWISGDEVLPAVQKALESQSSEFTNASTGEKLKDWPFKPVYAQAYLGGFGVAAALSHGADIVICGRVSDASLVIGAAVWWHSWTSQRLPCLANALVAGHLIECSTYVTGGNFSGFKRLEDGGWQDLGFPICEIASNGQVTITKQRDTGGIVSVDTCTSQLLYEISGPWYFNSDVTADLSSISFKQLTTDRVALNGVKALPPPPTTRVGLTAKGGFQSEMHWFLVGLDIDSKAAMLETQLRRALAPHMHRFTRLEFTLNGSSPQNPASQNAATIDFRVLAQALDADALAPTHFARPCLDNIMQAYPGATPHLDLRLAFPRPIYEYWVTLLPQSAVRHVAHIPWAPAASEIEIPSPTPDRTRKYPPQQPNQPSSALVATTTKTTTKPPPTTRSKARNQGPAVLGAVKGGLTDAAGGWAELQAPPGRSVIREVFGRWGRTVAGPLGWLVHARSGDKGSDANVGFWPMRRGKEEWDWLRWLLSARKIEELLGREGRGKPGRSIERFEFTELRAIHFLLRNHLDRGVSCTTSYDFLGKNVAEFLRAKWVDLPVRFLERGKL